MAESHSSPALRLVLFRDYINNYGTGISILSMDNSMGTYCLYEYHLFKKI